MLKSLSIDSKRFNDDDVGEEIHSAMDEGQDDGSDSEKERLCQERVSVVYGDPTLDNLRPIGLLEILRKIWAGIVICRIQRVRGRNMGIAGVTGLIMRR
jgi:hypothetical protein